MATNEVFEKGTRFSAACSDPATPVSNDPVLVNQIPGVCVVSEGADGNATITTEGFYNLSVKGVTTAAANAAIAVGDILYYVPANTPKLSKASGDAGAVRFGYAMAPVTSGATTIIPVKLGY